MAIGDENGGTDVVVAAVDEVGTRYNTPRKYRL
jgi:hypothetical protein